MRVVQPDDLHRLRWMMFVDGENLTIRAQEVAGTAGITLTPGAHYRRDVFVWLPGIGPRVALAQPKAAPKLQDFSIRSHFYTSLTGSHDTIAEVEESLWTLGFQPVVFKRSSDTRKAKGVDVTITRDLLVHAFRDHYDVAVIMAGDGDYAPVIDEVKRAGKLVYGLFFEDSKGMNPKFRLAVDEFFHLTSFFCQQWKANSNQPEDGSATAAT